MAQDIGLGGAGMLGAAFGGAPRLRRQAFAQAQNDLARAFEQAQAGYRDQQAGVNFGAQAALTQNRVDALAPGVYSQTLQGMGISKQRADAMELQARMSGKFDDSIAQGGLRVDAAAPMGDPARDLPALGIHQTAVSGGTAFNPLLTPAGQNLLTTAVGQAMKNRDSSAAGASNARATLYGTQNTALLHPDQVPGAASNKPSGGGSGVSRTDQADAAVSAVNQMVLAHKITAAEARRRFNVMGRPDLARRVYDPSLDAAGQAPGDDGQ